MTRSYSKKRERNEAERKFRKPLRFLVVRPRPGNQSQGQLIAGGAVFRCALGRGGLSSNKREGDGATPIAEMRVLSGYFRRGSFAAPSQLSMSPIRADLGWCEVPADRNYNRPVKIPYAAAHESMLRSDPLYDCCIVLDWNIRPRRRNCGSAIFFHLARPGFTPTQGCVAVTARTMARLLPLINRHTVLRVTR